MTLSNPNRSPATLTKTRVKASALSPASASPAWMGVPVPCEIGRSAVRGRETAVSPCPSGRCHCRGGQRLSRQTYSHFNVQGTCVGAVGMEADSDKACFPGGGCECGNRGGPTRCNWTSRASPAPWGPPRLPGCIGKPWPSGRPSAASSWSAARTSAGWIPQSEIKKGQRGAVPGNGSTGEDI